MYKKWHDPHTHIHTSALMEMTMNVCLQAACNLGDDLVQELVHADVVLTSYDVLSAEVSPACSSDLETPKEGCS